MVAILERAEAAPTAAPERKSPFNVCMDIWASWVSLKDFAQMGEGWSNLQDCKEFMRCGEAVEVMINSLPRVQWWAIRKSRGISTVWIFPSVSLADTMQEAEQALVPKMMQNIATRRHFMR